MRLYTEYYKMFVICPVKVSGQAGLLLDADARPVDVCLAKISLDPIVWTTKLQIFLLLQVQTRSFVEAGFVNVGFVVLFCVIPAQWLTRAWDENTSGSNHGKLMHTYPDILQTFR